MNGGISRPRWAKLRRLGSSSFLHSYFTPGRDFARSVPLLAVDRPCPSFPADLLPFPPKSLRLHDQVSYLHRLSVAQLAVSGGQADDRPKAQWLTMGAGNNIHSSLTITLVCPGRTTVGLSRTPNLPSISPRSTTKAILERPQ